MDRLTRRKLCEVRSRAATSSGIFRRSADSFAVGTLFCCRHSFGAGCPHLTNPPIQRPGIEVESLPAAPEYTASPDLSSFVLRLCTLLPGRGEGCRSSRGTTEQSAAGICLLAPTGSFYIPSPPGPPAAPGPAGRPCPPGPPGVSSRLIRVRRLSRCSV
jgi:hypothetical protein